MADEVDPPPVVGQGQTAVPPVDRLSSEKPPSSSPGREFAEAPRSLQSNYPRHSAFSVEFVRGPGVHWDSLGTATSMVFGRWSTYLAGSFIVALPVVVLYVCMIFSTGMVGFGGTEPSVWPFFFFGLLIQLVLGLAFLCMISIGIGHLQNGTPSLSDFALPLRRPKATMASLGLFMIPSALVFIPDVLLQPGVESIGPKQPFVFALAVIGLVLMGIVSLASFFYYPLVLISAPSVLRASKPPIEALKILFQRLGWGGLFMAGLLFLVSGLLAYVGVFVCLFGVLLTFPIMANVLALHYVYCFPEEQPQPIQAEINLSPGLIGRCILLVVAA